MEIKTTAEVIKGITLQAIPRTEDGVRIVSLNKDRIVSCGTSEIVFDPSGFSDKDVESLQQVFVEHGEPENAMRIGHAQDQCNFQELVITVK